MTANDTTVGCCFGTISSYKLKGEEKRQRIEFLCTEKSEHSSVDFLISSRKFTF